ncbi:MAG: hypothetical protein GQ564_21735 [Bacteroidales bacterium]|nr:hypothetical protein [Bacteroidales bacterium]
MKKLSSFILLALFYINSYGQLDLSNFLIKEIGYSNESTFDITPQSHYLLINKISGKLVITYPISDTIRNLKIIDDYFDYQVASNFEEISGKSQSTIIYSFKNRSFWNKVYFEYDLVLPDTMLNKKEFFSIYFSLDYQLTNISKIDCPINQKSMPYEISGNNTDYLKLKNEYHIYPVPNQKNLSYYYYRDEVSKKLNLVITNDTIKVMSFQDLSVNIYTINKYLKNGQVYDYIELNIDKIGITPNGKKKIIVTKPIDIYTGTDNNQTLYLTIEGQNSISPGTQFDIKDENSEISIAKIKVIASTRENNTVIYNCQIKPISETVNNQNAQNIYTKINGVKFYFENFKIYRKPAEPKISIIDNSQNKIITDATLYYGFSYQVIVKGQNVDKFKVSFPNFIVEKDVSINEDKQNERIFDIKLDCWTIETSDQIEIKYPSIFSESIVYPFSGKQYTSAVQPNKESFISLILNENDVWDEKSEYWFYGDINSLKITFIRKLLGEKCSSNFLGNQSFNISVLIGDSLKTYNNYLVKTLENDNASPETISFSIPKNDLLNKFRINEVENNWSEIKIAISSSILQYDFLVRKAVKNSFRLGTVSLSSNPITYDIVNNATYIPVLVSPFTSLSWRFYKKDNNLNYPKEPSVFYSFDIAAVAAINSGAYDLESGNNLEDFSPFDYGVLIMTRFNPLYSGKIVNDTKFKTTDFNMSLGLAYLFENSSLIVTFGLGIAFDDIRNINNR